MITPQNDIIFAGDWHGSSVQAKEVILSAHIRGIDTILHVGDFGIWDHDSRYLNSLQNMLEGYGITIYFVDGNHENFHKLYMRKLEEDGTRRIRDNIYHLPRGHRFIWNDISFLALGGAASIDKKFRRENYTWWKEEFITPEDVLKAQEGGYADVMITHDTPADAPNFIIDDPLSQIQAKKAFGSAALNYCDNHRKVLQQVTNVVLPKIIVHGHYHKAMEAIYTQENTEEKTYIRGLDQGTGRWENHVWIFEFDKAKELINQLNKKDTETK